MSWYTADLPPFPAEGQDTLLSLVAGGVPHDTATLVADGRVLYQYPSGDNLMQRYYPDWYAFAAVDNPQASAAYNISPSTGGQTRTPRSSVFFIDNLLYMSVGYGRGAEGSSVNHFEIYQSVSRVGESAPGVPDWVKVGTVEQGTTYVDKAVSGGYQENFFASQACVGVAVAIGSRWVLPCSSYSSAQGLPRYPASLWTSENGPAGPWSRRMAYFWPGGGNGIYGHARQAVWHDGLLYWAGWGNVDGFKGGYSATGATWTTFTSGHNSTQWEGLFSGPDGESYWVYLNAVSNSAAWPDMGFDRYIMRVPAGTSPLSGMTGAGTQLILRLNHSSGYDFPDTFAVKGPDGKYAYIWRGTILTTATPGTFGQAALSGSGSLTANAMVTSTINTANPLDFMVSVETGWDVGTFDSKIFDDFTQPYTSEEIVYTQVTSQKVTQSALTVVAGVAHGGTRAAIYDSGLQDRVTSVVGLRAGVDLPGLLLFSRGNRSWVGTAMLTDISGRSRHGFSEGDVVWVGGGRATFQGGAGEIVSTPHNTAHTPAQPRIEAKVRLPFGGNLSLIDKGTYSLEVENDTLVYTYIAGGVTRKVTSDSMQQHGFKPRQDIIVGVEHINMPATRIRFLTSLDGVTFNVLGQDVAPGATHNVDDSTSPLVVGPGDGEVFWAKVMDSVNGTLLAQADFTDVPAGGISWGSMSGETWMVAHSLTAAEPETVLGVEPEEWGINLRGDPVKTPFVLERSAATVAVSLDIVENPTADTTLLSNEKSPSEFSILHTTLGLFRVMLGGSVYEKPATFGEPVITVAFDQDGADVYLDDTAFDLVVGSEMPPLIEIAPSQIGKGSTDDDDYLFTGVVVLDHRASEEEREILRRVLVA